MTPLERKRHLETVLTDAFSPTYLQVIDESHAHIGHAGSQGGASHFALEIAAPVFQNKKLVEAHRLIYTLISDLIPQEIHALRIRIC